jgi:hypothetical protein
MTQYALTLNAHCQVCFTDYMNLNRDGPRVFKAVRVLVHFDFINSEKMSINMNKGDKLWKACPLKSAATRRGVPA